MGVVEPGRQRLGPRQELGDAAPAGAAGRLVGGLVGQGADLPGGVARPQGQQQVARLEAGPADPVNPAQADRGQPGDVDSEQLMRGDHTGRARAAVEAPEPEADPVHRQRQQRTAGGGGIPEPGPLEDRAEGHVRPRRGAR